MKLLVSGRWFPQIVDNRDSGNLYPIYIYKKMVVLASEPVGGRSRATELPCFYSFYFFPLDQELKFYLFFNIPNHITMHACALS